MLRRSLSLLMALSLGLFLFACEVSDDTEDTTQDTVADGSTDDAEAPDPCAADGVCGASCALDGVYDVDCYPTQDECKDAYAENILTTWFNDTSLKDQMSPTTRNCDWTPGICEPQFRCDDQVTTPRPCFCDADCYAVDEEGNPTGLLAPCQEDDHCDSWCPTGADPDCAGDGDDGKYCQ